MQYGDSAPREKSSDMKRKILIICVLVFFVTFTKGQELRIVKTDSLHYIAKEFGLDSVLIVSRNFPIYKIDSLTAINLLDFVYAYSFPSKSEYFFRQMAHSWKVKPIQEKTHKLAVAQIESMLKETATLERRLIGIDDGLLIAITIQKPDSIENYLIDVYKHYSDLVEQYKELFPSAFKRFFHFFKDGTHSTVSLYKDVHMTCYKIMWTLGELESSFYDEKKLSYHNSKLEQWQKNPKMLRYYTPYREYEEKEVLLNQDYQSIGEIDFLNEPELVEMLQGYRRTECWTFILYHNKLGFLDVGCSFTPLAGHGSTFKIELYESNKIRLTMISQWIS